MLKGGDAGPVTFDLDGGIKDLRRCRPRARRGASLPLVKRTLACYDEAIAARFGPTEVSAVSAYWAKREAPALPAPVAHHSSAGETLT